MPPASVVNNVQVLIPNIVRSTYSGEDNIKNLLVDQQTPQPREIKEVSLRRYTRWMKNIYQAIILYIYRNMRLVRVLWKKTVTFQQTIWMNVMNEKTKSMMDNDV